MQGRFIPVRHLQVFLVENHDHPPPVRNLLKQGQLLLDVTQLVDHQQHQVSRSLGFTRPAHAFGFDRVVSVANTGSVHQVHRNSIDFNRFAQYITGGAGNFRDYGTVLPG